MSASASPKRTNAVESPRPSNSFPSRRMSDSWPMPSSSSSNSSSRNSSARPSNNSRPGRSPKPSARHSLAARSTLSSADWAVKQSEGRTVGFLFLFISLLYLLLPTLPSSSSIWRHLAFSRRPVLLTAREGFLFRTFIITNGKSNKTQPKSVNSSRWLRPFQPHFMEDIGPVNRELIADQKKKEEKKILALSHFFSPPKTHHEVFVSLIDGPNND